MPGLTIIHQIDGNGILLLELEIVERMGGNIDVNHRRIVSKIGYHQKHFIASLAEEGILALQVAVGIHQIEAVACGHSFLADGDTDHLIINSLEGLLFRSELVFGSTHEGIHTPIIKDGGTSVVATEAFLIHTTLAIFLTCIDHERVLLQQG